MSKLETYYATAFVPTPVPTFGWEPPLVSTPPPRKKKPNRTEKNNTVEAQAGPVQAAAVHNVAMSLPTRIAEGETDSLEQEVLFFLELSKEESARLPPAPAPAASVRESLKQARPHPTLSFAHVMLEQQRDPQKVSAATAMVAADSPSLSSHSPSGSNISVRVTSGKLSQKQRRQIEQGRNAALAASAVPTTIQTARKAPWAPVIQSDGAGLSLRYGVYDLLLPRAYIHPCP